MAQPGGVPQHAHDLEYRWSTGEAVSAQDSNRYGQEPRGRNLHLMTTGKQHDRTPNTTSLGDGQIETYPNGNVGRAFRPVQTGRKARS